MNFSLNWSELTMFDFKSYIYLLRLAILLIASLLGQSVVL